MKRIPKNLRMIGKSYQGDYYEDKKGNTYFYFGMVRSDFRNPKFWKRLK